MLDPGQNSSDDQASHAGVESFSLAADHSVQDAHRARVGGNLFPTTSQGAHPRVAASSGITLPPTIAVAEPEHSASAATISDPGHSATEAHESYAGADLHDALLAVLADTLDDLERVRIATQNRVRSLQQVKGLGGTKFEGAMTERLDALLALEHNATLDLQRAMRLHPLHAFVKQTRGLGEKQAARLLAAIGNPADRSNPAKLWQYAGHGDPARSRKRKGQTVEFSPTAKMRVHLCAESAMKQRCEMCKEAAKDRAAATPIDDSLWSPPHNCTCPTTHPLRAVYDRERAKWADRETSDGHKHNHALRVVGKRLLLDMWKASKEVTA